MSTSEASHYTAIERAEGWKYLPREITPVTTFEFQGERFDMLVTAQDDSWTMSAQDYGINGKCTCMVISEVQARLLLTMEEGELHKFLKQVMQ